MKCSALLVALVLPLLRAGCRGSQATSVGAEPAEVRAALEARLLGKKLSYHWRRPPSTYEAKVGSSGVQPRSGRCSDTSWAGERPWEHVAHGEASADGRVLCYFHQGDSYIVWTVTENRPVVDGLVRLIGCSTQWTIMFRRLGEPSSVAFPTEDDGL